MEEELNMDSASMNSDEEAQLNALEVKNENAIKNIPAMKKILDKMNKDLLTPFNKLNKKMAWSERPLVLSDSAIETGAPSIDVNNDV
jgi:hypothetical protein